NQLQFDSGAAVLRNFTVTGKNGPHAINNFDGLVGGNVLFSFGNGQNNLGTSLTPVNPTVMGASFNYIAGNGNNEIHLGPTASATAALFNFVLGNGTNNIVLESNFYRGGRIYAGTGVTTFQSAVPVNYPLFLRNVT